MGELKISDAQNQTEISRLRWSGNVTGTDGYRIPN